MFKMCLLSVLILGAFLGLIVPAGGDAPSDAVLPPENEVHAEASIQILNSTNLDVSVRPLATDALEISSAANTHLGASNATLRFALWDGEEIAFALPDQPQKMYHFKRLKRQLIVELERIEFVDAAQIN